MAPRGSAWRAVHTRAALAVQRAGRCETRVSCPVRAPGRLLLCVCARSGPLAGPCAHTSLESGTDPPSGELVSGGGRMAPGELRPRTQARHRPVQRPGSAPSFPEVLGTPRRPRPAAVAPHGSLGCEASACGVTTSRMKPHVTAGPGRRSGACLPAAAGRGPSWGPPVSARRPAPSARAPLPGASPSVSCRSGPRKVREGAGGQARGGRGSAVLLAGLRPPGLRSSVRSRAAPAVPSAPCAPRASPRPRPPRVRTRSRVSPFVSSTCTWPATSQNSIRRCARRFLRPTRSSRGGGWLLAPQREGDPPLSRSHTGIACT